MGNVAGSEVYKLRLHRPSGQSNLAMGWRKDLLGSWPGGLLLQKRNLVVSSLAERLQLSLEGHKETRPYNAGLRGSRSEIEVEKYFRKLAWWR